MPTPARRAISSSGASRPCPEKTSRAAATIASRLRWASRRSPLAGGPGRPERSAASRPERWALVIGRVYLRNPCPRCHTAAASATAATAAPTTPTAARPGRSSWPPLQRSGQLQRQPIGVLERQHRNPEWRQVGDAAVLDAALLERLHGRLQVRLGRYPEAQVVEAAAERDDAVLEDVLGEVVIGIASRRRRVHGDLEPEQLGVERPGPLDVGDREPKVMDRAE